MEKVERWGVFETAVPGRTEGNPFTDYEMQATFTGPQETRTVEGFYDGDGTWRVRFMPSFEGEYTYRIYGNFSDCGTEGRFLVTAPGPNNHGPVRVRNRYHLAWEDGTPHYSLGTTCYTFDLQREEIVEETFRELEKGYFNKIRFCLFPKHYDFCLYDPIAFPYEGTPMDASVLTRENFDQYNGNPPGNHWDFTRFNPAFFRIHDRTIRRLMDMGIEADLILFHAYDRWGFSQMSMEDNRRYLRYVTARYSAFRNVWWALANEYELLHHSEADWDILGKELRSHDPYGHLLSIHNCEVFYDYSKDWITHCSCQRCDHYRTTESTDELRMQYGKPVVWDEFGYEGDFPHCWGNFTPEEIVRRSWEALLRGGYCGHGETFLSEDNVIWWAHGGRLKGQSAERFRFMKDFLADVPGCGLKLAKLRDDKHFQWDDKVAVPEAPRYEGTWYFFYYSLWQPAFRQIWVDDTTWFDVDVIDTWQMTVTPIGRRRGRFNVPLGTKQYMGIRLRKSEVQDDL
ncbi:MAG: DUF5060 domain-containing protein [Lachnospiraceae bacterium]|nr:DUF5060 domain-containing protein [Lachnospiraceae bacterium]